MLKSKYIDRICIAAAVLALVITILFMNGEALGLIPASAAPGYETRLFDDTRVHTLDIIMEDWMGFLETAGKEEYSACTIVIDGEEFSNVGLKG